MPLTITFLGHAGFYLDTGDARIAIDPFLTGNPVATLKPADLKPNHIVLTHGHSDHFGDTVELARTNRATLYATFEACNFASKKGVPEEQLSPGNPGGKIRTPFGYVAFTQAFHSSSNEGVYCGMPCGVIVRIDSANLTFHHCGDTALFSDLRLIGELYKPDVSAVPVGDRFTMGPELGKIAAEFIRPRFVIPVHHSTWPLLTSDLSAFTPHGVEVKTMKPGEAWNYPT